MDRCAFYVRGTLLPAFPYDNPTSLLHYHRPSCCACVCVWCGVVCCSVLWHSAVVTCYIYPPNEGKYVIVIRERRRGPKMVITVLVHCGIGDEKGERATERARKRVEVVVGGWVGVRV